MARYQPEQLFEVARSAHNELYGLVEEITAHLKQAGVAQASASDLITYVDAILQVCLLNGSFADGQIETNELIFIKNIANSIDVLIPVNNSIYEKNSSWSYINWEQIPFACPEKQRMIISSSIGIIKPFADNFVGALATIDALVQKDYLAEFTNRFSRIFITLAGIDGDDLSSEDVKGEGTLSFACYKVLVVDKWNQTIKQIQSKERPQWQS
jgi:hypothetical protein